MLRAGAHAERGYEPTFAPLPAGVIGEIRYAVRVDFGTERVLKCLLGMRSSWCQISIPRARYWRNFAPA